jgi:hypothetical protein
MSTFQITTQAQIRQSFWEANPQFKRQGRKTQNQYPCDVRVTFVDYVENLKRNNQISEKLGQRATL